MTTKALKLAEPSYPVPSPVGAATDAHASRIDELAAKKDLTEDEHLELMVLKEEALRADAGARFLTTLPNLKVVHQAQVFLDSATEETMKTIRGVVLDSRLVRTYWPTDDEKKAGEVPSSLDGPWCSSMDMEIGSFFNADTKRREPRGCRQCPYNRDLRQRHPETAGRCKIANRILFLPLLDDETWAPIPYLLRVSQSSAGNVGQLYENRQARGYMCQQIPVELSLEKRENDDILYSVMKVKQIAAPIESIAVRARFLEYVRHFGPVMGIAPTAEEFGFDVEDADAEVEGDA